MSDPMYDYAVRYCITRDSYAFNDGLDIANQYWDDLADSTKRDVLAAIVGRLDMHHWPTIQTALKATS